MLFYRNRAGLILCRYSRSGDMTGASYHVALERSGDGMATLSVSSKEQNGAPEQHETHTVPLSALDGLAGLINIYQIPAWQNRAKSRIQALDAATVTLQLRYKNGERIIVTSNQRLPRNSGKAFAEVLAAMLSAVSTE